MDPGYEEGLPLVLVPLHVLPHEEEDDEGGDDEPEDEAGGPQLLDGGYGHPNIGNRAGCIFPRGEGE